MAVKILIKRKFKEGALKNASRLIIQARYNAMNQPGYISSETWSACDRPDSVTVVSMWQHLKNWEQYKKSEIRTVLEAEIENLLAAPTEYEVYDMGLQRD